MALKSSFRHGLYLLVGLSLSARALVAAPAAPNNDLIPGWGHFLNADGDCSYQLDDEQLTINVPGTAHDLSAEQGLMNAPIVIQEMLGDFTVQVKISGDFEPGDAVVAGRSPYQGAGLMLGQDVRNYIRLERGTYVKTETGQSFPYANFEVRLNGQLVRIGQANDYPLEAGQDTILKIERHGDTVSGAVSTDGEDWHALGDKPFRMARKLFVGVTAVNASTAPFSPQFADLKVEGQKVEDNAVADAPK
jgi:regulation of enolase protein 1 (concanavalin A-like superfamily)